MTTLAILAVGLLAGGQAHAATASVSITSPTENSTVKGTVTITATASAGAGDHVTTVVFYDGPSSIGTFDCEGAEPCVATTGWSATGLSGTHSLTARAFTAEDASATSAAVSVKVESPPPSIAIVSPTPGSVVKGTIQVSVSAATDPSQDDYPNGIVVYDGANNLGNVSCQEQQTCQGSVSWRATGLTGVHNLTARVTTRTGVTITSPATAVTVLSPAPSVRITSPAPGARLGGNIVVRASAQTDPSQADYPTSITLYDGSSQIGSISCQGQQTCGGSVAWNTHGLKGRHTIAAVVHTDTGRSATSPHVTVGGTPTPRYAPIHCRLSSYATRVHRRVRGLCTMPGVPKGTRVAVQYRQRSGWATAVSGSVAADGTYRFKLRGTKKATYSLSALVSANRVYAATRATIGVLRVR